MSDNKKTVLPGLTTTRKPIVTKKLSEIVAEELERMIRQEEIRKVNTCLLNVNLWHSLALEDHLSERLYHLSDIKG